MMSMIRKVAHPSQCIPNGLPKSVRSHQFPFREISFSQSSHSSLPTTNDQRTLNLVEIRLWNFLSSKALSSFTLNIPSSLWGLSPWTWRERERGSLYNLKTGQEGRESDDRIVFFIHSLQFRVKKLSFQSSCKICHSSLSTPLCALSLFTFSLFLYIFLPYKSYFAHILRKHL